MARLAVTDPDGDEWFVWRRWYVWRRLLTMRDCWGWSSTSSGDTGGSGGSSTGIDDLIMLPFFLLALLATVVSLVDMAAQLVVLPIALLLRSVRLTRWPVQVDRGNKHVRTLRVRGFANAAALRDAQAAVVRNGAGAQGDAAVAA
jgi:hypothetical protein